jgi:hypothetical protein
MAVADELIFSVELLDAPRLLARLVIRRRPPPFSSVAAADFFARPAGRAVHAGVRQSARATFREPVAARLS